MKLLTRNKDDGLVIIAVLKYVDCPGNNLYFLKLLPWYFFLVYLCFMKIDEAIKSKFDSPQTRAFINVKYTASFLSGISNKFMSTYGMTMPQFNILRILRGANEAMAVNTIKDRMVEKSPNTTRLMDKLIDKELISRERCENDRRVVYVRITEKGLDLLAKIDVALKKTDLQPGKLTDEEANTLSDLLDKLRG